jgi:IPT/TIG domain
MADPTIIGCSPTSGPAGTSVTITGTGLSAVTAVILDALSCPISNQSDTAIIVVIPSAATAGSFGFTLAWTGTVTLTGGFAVTPGGPPPPPPPAGKSNELVLVAGLGGALLLAVLLLGRKP